MESPLSSNHKIRRPEPRDLERIAAIEAACLPWATHWTAESYLCPPEGEMWAAVAEGEQGIAGFVLARWISGELEILNLAVDPPARHRRAGRMLVHAAIDEAIRRGASQVLLEVRESNEAAYSFYTGIGFVTVGRRPGYYREPDEAAVLMSFPLVQKI